MTPAGDERQEGAGARPDLGLTLAEMLVATLVGLIVLTILGSVLPPVLKYEQRAVGLERVVGARYATQMAITGAVRNAAENGVHIGAAGDRLVLHTRSAGTADTWECRAWQVVRQSPESGILYTTVRPVGTDLAAVDDPSAAGWTAVEEVFLQAGANDSFYPRSFGVGIQLTAASGRHSIASTEAVRRGDVVLTGGDFQVRQLPQDVEGNGGCFT